MELLGKGVKEPLFYGINLQKPRIADSAREMSHQEIFQSDIKGSARALLPPQLISPTTLSQNSRSSGWQMRGGEENKPQRKDGKGIFKHPNESQNLPAAKGEKVRI